MSDLLHLDIYADGSADDRIVCLEAQTAEGRLALPLKPQVARAIAVQLMMVADEAEGVGAS